MLRRGHRRFAARGAAGRRRAQADEEFEIVDRRLRQGFRDLAGAGQGGQHAGHRSADPVRVELFVADQRGDIVVQHPGLVTGVAERQAEAAAEVFGDQHVESLAESGPVGIVPLDFEQIRADYRNHFSGLDRFDQAEPVAFDIRCGDREGHGRIIGRSGEIHRSHFTGAPWQSGDDSTGRWSRGGVTKAYESVSQRFPVLDFCPRRSAGGASRGRRSMY